MNVYRCLAAALFLMVTLTACSTKSPQLAAVPDTLTLYSIDGGKERPVSVDKDKEAFRGYPVIGKVDVTDQRQRGPGIAGIEPVPQRHDHSVETAVGEEEEQRPERRHAGVASLVGFVGHREPGALECGKSAARRRHSRGQTKTPGLSEFNRSEGRPARTVVPDGTASQS